MNITVAEVFSPGEHLREELEARGWTQEEFAEIIGRSCKQLENAYRLSLAEPSSNDPSTISSPSRRSTS